MGLNPHSNGESFSRSIFFFLPKMEESIITINEIKKIMHDIINKFKIIYIKIFKPYDWKSYILIILYKFILNIFYPPHQ